MIVSSTSSTIPANSVHYHYDLSELHSVIELLRLLGVHSKERYQFRDCPSMQNTIVYLIQDFNADNTPCFMELHYINNRGQSTIVRYRL